MKEQDEKRFAEVYHKQWKDFHIEWEGDIPYTVCDTIQMDRTNSQKNYNLFLAGLEQGRKEKGSYAKGFVDAINEGQKAFDRSVDELEERWRAKVEGYYRKLIGLKDQNSQVGDLESGMISCGITMAINGLFEEGLLDKNSIFNSGSKEAKKQ